MISAKEIVRIKNGIEKHSYFTAPKVKGRSKAWEIFDWIYSDETKEQIEHFFCCKKCKEVVHHAVTDGNTTKLLRHVCFDHEKDSAKLERVVIKESEREEMKLACAKFVAKDLHSARSVEGQGLFELAHACMRFGQKNCKATRNDLARLLPSRNTVTSKIADIANDCREKTSGLLRKALETGGIAATTDCWTDDYRHTNYICIVAHLCIESNGQLSYSRCVLNTSEVNEIVKTGRKRNLTLF